MQNCETIENVDYAIFYLDYFVPYYHCLWLISTNIFYDLVAFRFFIVANNKTVRKRILDIHGSTKSLQYLYKKLDAYWVKTTPREKPFIHYRTYDEGCDVFFRVDRHA